MASQTILFVLLYTIGQAKLFSFLKIWQKCLYEEKEYSRQTVDTY